MPRITPTLVVAALLLPSAAFLAFAPAATAAPTVSHVTITSFDGVAIAATLFLPENASATSPVPFVLMTHGWAGERATEPTGRVGDLLAAGYGVLTWDSRGFGASGGEVQLNSPDYEVRDVSALLTYLVENVPSAARVGSDPVVGMSGGSYAGGIQLLAAAFDERIDVIAPEITWNDLARSLAPNGVPKLYWTSLLFAAGLEASCVNARNGDPFGAFAAAAASSTTGCQTSDLARYYAEVHATNSVSEELAEALAFRSPATYMSEIDVPTLLIQGFPDTLFDVDQATANYEGIKANGAPVKLWLYDGGHGHPEGPALANTQGELISATVINWFDRHLRGDIDVDTGAEVQYYAGGYWHNATAWPDLASSIGTKQQPGLPVVIQGPVTGGSSSTVTLKLADGPTVLAGRASVSFDATGPGPEGFAFFSLGVQSAAGTIAIADLQVQPTRFPLSIDGTTPVEVDLVAAQANVPAGSSLVLQIATFDRNFNGNRVPGYTTLLNIDVEWRTI